MRNIFVQNGKTIRFIAILLGLWLLFEPALVSASPGKLNQKKADYQQVKAQIDEIDTQLDDAVETYNNARYRLAQTNQQLNVTSAKLAEVQAHLQHHSEWLDKRLRDTYMRGKISFIAVVLDSRSFEQFLNRYDMLVRIGKNDAAIVKNIRADKAEVEAQKALLVEQQQKRATFVKQAKAQKKTIEKKLQDRQALLVTIQDELTQLEREEAVRQAQLRAMYAARFRAAASSYSAPKGAAHGNVVSIALAQLGKPYHWGADGPDSFDCSGLMMYCYAQIGIYLPHSAAAQYDCGERVSRGDLKPGDLVFFGRSHISHVGMYIGDGNFIHAPHTGDVVKISSLDSHGGYVGAARP